MKEFELKGTKRTETGKKATRELRKKNQIPCVIYGSKKDDKGMTIATEFVVDFEAIRKLVYTPNIYLVNIDIDGEKSQAVMKELQFHPVKDNLLHIDFYQVTPGQAIKMAVPVSFEGHAAGVRAGGVLNTNVRKLAVKALVEDIPEKLVVDITPLEIGKKLEVADLHYDKLELLARPDALVCSVRSTRAVAATDEEAAPAEAAAETAAPAEAAAPAEEKK